MVLRLGWVPLEALAKIREGIKPFPSFLAPIAVWEQRALLLAVALPEQGDRVHGVLAGHGFQPHSTSESTARPQLMAQTLGDLHRKLNFIERDIESLGRTRREQRVQYL